MARRKQAVPLQRQTSNFDKGLPESPKDGWKHSNGNGALSPNEKPGTEELPPSIVEQAGPIQLIICVGGIYASL